MPRYPITLAAVCFVLAVAAGSPARADLRRDIKRAQRAIENAQDEVDDAGKRCRRGLATNLSAARKRVKALKRRANARSVKDALTLVAGLVVAARSARCPEEVIDELRDARSRLKRVRRRLDDASDDDDNDNDDDTGRARPGRGGGVRGLLGRALRKLGDVQDGLAAASAKCRSGIAGNVGVARRKVRGLKRGPTLAGLKHANGFMAGLYMACKLSRCRGALCPDLHGAHKAVHAAMQRFERGGGDDDGDDGGGGGGGGGHRRLLRKAQRAMEGGLAALPAAHKRCRDAMTYNMRHSAQTLRVLRTSGTRKTISDHGLFVAGMVLAAGLAKCPAAVSAPIQQANSLIQSAKAAYR